MVRGTTPRFPVDEEELTANAAICFKVITLPEYVAAEGIVTVHAAVVLNIKYVSFTPTV